MEPPPVGQKWPGCDGSLSSSPGGASPADPRPQTPDPERTRVATACQPAGCQQSLQSCVSQPSFPSAFSTFPLLLEVLEGEVWMESGSLRGL